MKNSNIKVSIIIPSYNSEDFIEQALNSAVNQSLKDIEIICVDAKSSDKTLDIINSFIQKDKRVKLLLSEHKSYGYQMNLALEHAQGEYFGIIESDDYAKLNMYEELYTKAKKENLDLVKADYIIFQGKTQTYKKVVFQYNDLYSKTSNALEDLRLFLTDGINQIGIYKLDLVRINNIKLNITPGASYQDNGLYFQLFCYAKTIGFINKALYMLRRDNVNSSVYSKGKIFAACKEYDFIREFLRNKEFEDLVKPICAYHRFGNYIFTLERIDPSYIKVFLKKFKDDFIKIIIDDELTCEFFTKDQLNTIEQIVKDDEAYYLKYYKNYEFLKEHKNVLMTNNAQIYIKSMLSYRLGQALIQNPFSFVFKIKGIYKEFRSLVREF